VARTIVGIVAVPTAEVVAVVGAAATGAVLWNLLTWRLGLPSSSGHALLGGLVGAAVADAGGHAVRWGGFSGAEPVGVIGALTALAVAPLLGFAAGALAEWLARRATLRASAELRTPVKRAEWVTTATLAGAHGANDAQKSVGVILAALIARHEIGASSTPLWVTIAAACALTLGTTMGGWPIVRTLGRRIFRLRPIDGLASQTGGAVVMLAASFAGAPVSTTQVVASSTVGVALGRRRWRHIGWATVREMGTSWLATVPACALLAALALPLWNLFA
jgi:PiT family inorganic phosphate transporter